MHVVGTAGHVDHGKSSLIERLTGMDPDRFAEEKRRGLTIDLGFAWLTTPSGKEIGIIDVPGHERFIKNMLAGAGGISVCLFVVAANEGWMPQSSEHLSILEVLGIEHGVVALTKADLVDTATLEMVRTETEEHLRGTKLEGISIVACSARDRGGISELVSALDRALDGAPRPPDTGRPRLWVDRVFTIGGAGTVVTGTLAGGSLRVGDSVSVVPEGRRARIRSIQSHKKNVEEAAPGNRVALNLVGLGRDEAARGDAIVLPHQAHTTTVVDAVIEVLPETVSGIRHELSSKGSHLLYCGSAETPVRVSLLDTPAIGPGETALARLRLRDPLSLVRGDRFVLRDAGRIETFGGGRVLDPLPTARGSSRADLVNLLRRLVEASPDEALAAIVSSEGMIERSRALLRSGASGAGHEVVELGDALVSSDRALELTRRLIETLEQWHEQHPLEAGMPKEILRASLDLEQGAFDALVARTEETTAEGSYVRLASFGVRLDPAQERARGRLLEKIESAGYSPPRRRELGEDDDLVRALIETGELVAVGDFFLTRGQAEGAQALVREAISSSGPMTVAQIRDLLGTTRKYAVPLCEWLDSSGTTRRRGDVRVLAAGS
ncbi:MAG: selenocysteine-specific translation elongation factor [Actinomycetota bacterium]|nr:selenocysteine-specific translation elongation factor [Actinomycetota bacterium]